jgi:putative endonuclease
MVIHVEFFESKSEALKRESFYKTGVGRDLIRDLIRKFPF